jgi:MoaA/NifB/PqqE/SkfB family radical SAM enzyme
MRSTTAVVLKIPLYKSFRTFSYPKVLPLNYTFLISTVCNSRCRTCNIWKQKHKFLTLPEWRKIFKSIGKSVFWATISGGEPFLQPHLAEMVAALDKICEPGIINIPTNSLLPETIKVQVEKILKVVTRPQVVINLSLDGVWGDHDYIRRIPGNFEKVMENYKNLKRLQNKYKNLTVGFGTVVSNFNINKFKKVFDFVYKLEPNQYLTEIAEERVELGTINTAITPEFKKYKVAIDYLISKMRQNKFRGIGRISRAFRFEYYQFVKDWLRGKKLLPDYAGFASCEISSDGEVWPSCIQAENMGNLRGVNYDFSEIWFGAKANEIRSEIKKHGSSYPLANAFYSSALMNVPTMVKVVKEII